MVSRHSTIGRALTVLAPVLTLALVSALMITALAGCSDAVDDVTTTEVEGANELQPLYIGTLSTEDALPLWAAEELGLFEQAGLPEVEIVVFQAAVERDTAFVAGEIDAFMGDIIACAALEAAGSHVTIGTIMLGTTTEQGRFGIVASPEAAYNDLAALEGVPIGTSASTIQEYVVDGLMRQAGISADQVVKEEVPKVPIRFDLLMNNQLEAAALPEPLLSLAESQGATLLADDATGENLSQTVLAFSDEYLTAPGGIETMTVLLDVWDQAVAIVNADPDAWRDTLVDKARLPEPLKDIYEVNVYPEHQVPTNEQVEAVLTWMDDKGTLSKELTYEDLVLVTP